jgi:hypothetical protein
MKKTVLFSALIGLALPTLAQNMSKKVNLGPPIAVPSGEVKYYTGAEQLPSPSLIVPNTAKINNRTGRSFNPEIIGSTYYDLQSNGSIQNRLKRHQNGTISAVWTMSDQQDGVWANRGTGYNFFDGTNWLANPSSRIENARTGWPSINGIDGNITKELVITHNTEASKVHIAQRGAIGSGSWANSQYTTPHAGGNFWPRTAVGGPNNETLHLISLTQPANGGTATPYTNGQAGAILYSRSNDGGVNWDIEHIVIDGMGPEDYSGFSADEYAIAAKGNVVAIVVGNTNKDVFIVKSVDNGTTWTKSRIYPHPVGNVAWEEWISPDLDDDGELDLIYVSDGTVALAIDNNNNVHVAYGIMRILKEDIGTAYSWYPTTSGIAYWNETMPETVDCLPVIGDLLDEDGDGDITLAGGIASFGRYTNSGLTTMPSMGVSAANEIFVTYSSIVENSDNGGMNQYFRNLYIVRSADMGQTWSLPINLTNDPTVEAVYAFLEPTMAGDSVRILVQTDDEPGITVSGDEDAPRKNEMWFYGFPIADLTFVTNSALECLEKYDVNYELSVKREKFEQSVKLFPNPANGSATVNLSRNKSGQVTVSVFNSLGMKVNEITQTVNSGNSNINLDLSGYPTGLYIVNITSEGKNHSAKLMVK